jgi:hypothetical protein
MVPPKDGGRHLPRGLIPNDGTQEEEIKALKLVFRLDGSNPYNVLGFWVVALPAN